MRAPYKWYVSSFWKCKNCVEFDLLSQYHYIQSSISWWLGLSDFIFLILRGIIVRAHPRADARAPYNRHVLSFWISAFFLGGHLEESWLKFFQWYRFSHVHVQIGWELVWLITLIGLNKYLIKFIFPKLLKKFYGRLFDTLSSNNTHLWCSIGVYKQFYYNLY